MWRLCTRLSAQNTINERWWQVWVWSLWKGIPARMFTSKKLKSQSFPFLWASWPPLGLTLYLKAQLWLAPCCDNISSMVCPCVLVLLGTSGLLCLWASQVSWASMSFQDTWASWASSMLKAFKKAFNIEEAQEAHVSWKDIEAQETWEAQRPKRPKRPRHHQLMEGQIKI